MTDSINPTHYKVGEIECIDAIKSALGVGFSYYLQGQIMKYMWRFRHKGQTLDDLQKAEWYLVRLINEERRALEPPYNPQATN